MQSKTPPPTNKTLIDFSNTPPPPKQQGSKIIPPKKTSEDTVSSSDESIIDLSPVKKKIKRVRLPKEGGNICKWVLKKGSKKGEKCHKRIAVGETLCRQHSVSKHVLKESVTTTPVNVIQTVPVINETINQSDYEFFCTKIGRLAVGKKYFLIRLINPRHKIVLLQKEGGVKYTVKIPKQLLPIPQRNAGYYLIRNENSKLSEWKC